VVLVPNNFAPYSRALRVARSLTDEGYAVEIAAMLEGDVPVEEHDGSILVRRYATDAAPERSRADLRAGSRAITPDAGDEPGPRQRPARRSIVERARGALRAMTRWIERVVAGLTWPPDRYRGWWRRLDAELAPADLYHCCGMFALQPALSNRKRHGNRGAVVVYDVVDDWFRSQVAMAIPGPIRRLRILAENRRAVRCDAIITVNDVLADRLQRRWHPAPPVLSIPNYPQIPDLPLDGCNLIRAELGLPETMPIVLYQGLLNAFRPIELAEEAALLVPGAAFVVMGYGTYFDRVRSRDDDPRYAGRHFTLAARPPDEVLAWTASADASLMRFRASSPNDRLATPNKFWESLAAGTPVVASREQIVMARFVREHEVGVVADRMTPEALADAIRRVLERPVEERRAWRLRIAETARRDWSWPAAAAAYRGLVEEIRRERVAAPPSR